MRRKAGKALNKCAAPKAIDFENLIKTKPDINRKNEKKVASVVENYLN
jgi:hypothetical protein